MSTQLIAGDLVQLRIWTLQAEQAAVNTVYYIIGNPTGAGVSDVDMGTKFSAMIAPLMKPIMSTDCSFRGVQVNIVQRKPLPATVFITTDLGAGGAAPPDLPRQSCGLISWRTALAGRQYRGRWYQPFPSVGMCATDGIPTSAYQTSLANLATGMMNFTFFSNIPITGNTTCALFLHHRSSSSGTLPSATLITGYVIAAKFATQRRRGSYGRPNGSPI